MFHPVGSQPPSVYWRRRLVLLGSIGLLIVLLLLTVKIATSDGNAAEPTGGSGGGTTPVQTTPSSPVSHSRTSHAPSPTQSATGSPKSSTAAPQPCRLADLDVAAVAAKATYRVGDQPVLELEVTNTGRAPCVQDLADKQIELKVYNGESRVWGSHDCQIQPGTDEQVLAVDMPVRVAITWSGLSSQPHCAGTRQRVGAGTYTLYAVLSGKTGKATQFAIS